MDIVELRILGMVANQIKGARLDWMGSKAYKVHREEKAELINQLETVFSIAEDSIARIASELQD